MPSQLDSSQFGTYIGVLPCENCGSKQVILKLLEDDTYQLSEVHLDKPEKVCNYNGDFKYDEDTKSLRLPMEGNDARFEFVNGTLQILDKDGKKKVTEVNETPYLFKTEVDLSYAIWRVTSIEGNEVPKVRSYQSSMIFRADGSVTYTAGCNNCNGRYDSISKGELNLKVGACTKKMCEGEDWEMKLSKALLKCKKYSIADGELIMKDHQGSEVIRFRSLL